MSDTNPNATYAVIKELTPEERLREQARRREEAEFIESWALTSEFAEGFKEGFSETIAQSPIVDTMRSNGASEKEIQEYIQNETKSAWSEIKDRITVVNGEVHIAKPKPKPNPNPNATYAVIKELTPEERLREQARRREEALINERLALSAERNAEREKTINSFVRAMRSTGIAEERIETVIREATRIQSQDQSEDFEP